MKPVRLTVSLSLLALAFPAASLSDVTPEKLHFFKLPSKRIGCVYDSQSIRCDGPDAHPGRRPAKCDVDFGGAFGMKPTGRSSRLCHGDTALDKTAPTLRYGHVLRRFGFTCLSSRRGLYCHNRSGHGWKISLADTHLF
jgi:hypothetical protein